MSRAFFREASVCVDPRIKDIVAGKFTPQLTGRYITIADMVEDCKKHLLPKLTSIKLKGVAGVPRSGVLPASVCAAFLNLPLYSFSTDSGFIKLSARSSSGGRRMEFYNESEGKILLLDDTYFTGESMKVVRSSVKRQDILYASLYITPEKVEEVDTEEQLKEEVKEVEVNAAEEVKEDVSKEVKEELSKPAADPIKHSPETGTGERPKGFTFSQNKQQSIKDRIFEKLNN